MKLATGPPGLLQRQAAGAAILLSTALALAAPQAAPSPLTSHLTVYIEGGDAPSAVPRFTVSASGKAVPVISASRAASGRPLVLVLDPNTYRNSEMRTRIVGIQKGLAPHLDGSLVVLVGIPVLDGILSEAITAPASLDSTLDQVVTSYFGDRFENEGASLSRSLDLVRSLVRKVEDAHGATDVLIVARDRKFVGNEAEYLNAGTIRYLSAMSVSAGSTLYGYLEGSALIGEACTEGGGLAIASDQSLETAVRQIMQARSRAFALKLGSPDPETTGTRIALHVAAMDSSGKEFSVRAPKTLYLNPDSSSPPDNFRMRQGLDWLRRARDSEIDDNMTAAQRFVEASIQEDSWNPAAFYLAGRISMAVGEMTPAASHMARAVRLGAVDEPVLVGYATAFRRAGRSREAHEVIESLARTGRVLRPPLRLEVARLLAASRSYEDSRKVYTEIIATPLDSDKVRAEYGAVLAELGNEALASEQFQVSLDKNPVNPEALLYFSRSRAAAGKHEEAVSFARRALEAHPKDAGVHVQLGKLFGAQGNWEKAADHFQLGLVVAPSRREIVDLLVDALSRAGRPADAAGVLERVLEQDPYDVGAYRSLSALHSRNGDLAQAVATLEVAASKVASESYKLYREAAEVRERRAEYGQALLDYRAMLRSAPPEVARTLEGDLYSHLLFLSLVVHGGKNLADLPVEQNSRMATTLSMLSQRQDLPSADQKAAAGMRVPGGLTLLARTLGVEPALLREADAVEKMFSFMLEVSSQPNERLQDNPLRRDVVAYLRSYESLIRFLSKNGHLPEDFDPIKGAELIFSLGAEGQELKRTQKFLSFFGVNMKSKKAPDSSFSVILTLKQNKGTTQRQQLLRNLGVNLMERNLRSFRVVLKDENLPILFGSETWSNKLLANEKAESNSLLGRMVMSPKSMRLYLALSACSDAAREAVVRLLPPGEIVQLPPALLFMARYLDFKDGRIDFPGTPKSWEAFLGAGAGDTAGLLAALFRKDQGRSLILYYALAGSPKSVKDYFTDSPERLQKLYGLLANQDISRWGTLGGAMTRLDIGRVLRRLTADSQGLILQVDPGLAALVLRDSQKDESPPGGEFLRLDQRYLGPLADQGSLGGISWVPSQLDLLEFLKYAQTVSPDLLTHEIMNSILRSPSQALAALDLVWDLHPPPDVVLRYLSYCSSIAENGGRGWNVNRTRTAQSLLHLIVLLHKERALPRESAVQLVKEALEALSPADESAFAHSVARFLSTRLVPALPKIESTEKGADILLQALAGPQGLQEFSFDGRSIQVNFSAYRVGRMKEAIQHQRVNPLASLLQIYRLLGEVSAGRELPEESRASLRNLLAGVQSADFSPGVLGSSKQGIAYIDLEDLRRKGDVVLSSPGKARASGGGAQAQAELPSLLHAELGVSLLSYCYAYYGVPEADALAFDANFVRRHQFYDIVQNQKLGWMPTRLEQRDGGSAFFVGTVAGLGFEFSRLETAQTVQSFGKREGKSIVPTILTSLRTMERSLRSDRAQEYVALTVRLGRELLALSAINLPLRSWCQDQLALLVSPRRREQSLQRAGEGNPRAAAEMLSPSELYLLGLGYVNSAASPPESVHRTTAGQEDFGHAVGSTDGSGSPEARVEEDPFPPLSIPAFHRLREIAPEPGSIEEKAFRRELAQYGVLLRKRIGLNELSMEISDSYEQLENHPREEVLFERICDLKFRMAELNYGLGLPAYLAEVQGELAIRDILPATASVRTSSWKLALEQITKLNFEHARNWVEELLNRGILNVSSDPSVVK